MTKFKIKTIGQLIKVKTTPYEEFYKLVSKKTRKPIEELCVSNCYVNKEFAQNLLKLMLEWGKKNTKYTVKEIKKMVSWDHFQYGPVELDSMPYGEVLYKEE